MFQSVSSVISPGDEVFHLRLGQTGIVLGKKVYQDKRINKSRRSVFEIKRPGHSKATYWTTNACVKSSIFK